MISFTSFLAISTISLGILSLLCLFSLHIISPSFRPSFRMVSEYALGTHKWVLTVFFICWGISSITAAIMLYKIVEGGWATFGVLLIFVTGIGAIMGGLFDVKHKLHGLAFGIGIPFLPIGALIVTYHLLNNVAWQNDSNILLFSTHAIWISLVLMAGSMFLLFATLKSSGIAYGPDSPPFTELPKGVIGVNGWANRLLVVCYLFYPIWLAKLVLDTL